MGTSKDYERDLRYLEETAAREEASDEGTGIADVAGSVAQAAGLTTLPRIKGKPSQAQKAKIIEALVSGANYGDVAEQTAINPVTLKEWVAALQPHEIQPRKEVRDAMASKRYFTRTDCTYGSKKLARGEVFSLQGLLNDAKLESTGLIRSVPLSASTYKDDAWGKEFIDQAHAYSYRREQERLRRANTEEERERVRAQTDRQIEHELGLDRVAG